MTKPSFAVALCIAVTLAFTTFAQTPAPQATLTPSAPAATAVTQVANVPLPPVVRPANGPALLGDDFETGAIKGTPIVSGAATLEVVTDRVAHGKSALKVHYPAGTRGAWAFVGMPLPASLHDQLWGRAYVYISGAPPSHSVFMLAGTHGFPIADFLEIGTYNGLFQPSFQLNAPTPERRRGETVGHEGDIPIARWFCLEWRFTDKPADQIVMWIDGKQVVDKSFTMIGLSAGLTGGLLEYDFGFRSWAQAAAVTADMDVYYDDVAIGDKPIGALGPTSAGAR